MTVASHPAFRPCVVARPLGLFAFLLAQPLIAEHVATGQANQMADKVQRADAERERRAGEVVSLRGYVLRNKRWREDAVMYARMISAPGQVKRFEVISMESAGSLQKRVFMQVLEGEVSLSAKRLSTRGTDMDGSISVSNYTFSVLGADIINGRNCVILELLPKRKSQYLLNGRAWIDPEAAAVLRVEGQTAANVSFWIGKPAVSQDFRKVEELWLPSSNRSVSNVRYLGDTELTINYLRYTIAPPDSTIAQSYDQSPSKK